MIQPGLTFQEARNAFFDGGGVQHFSVTKLNQHGAFSMFLYSYGSGVTGRT